MTLRELVETLKCLGLKLALHDGDTITVEPPDLLTPALQAALAEHHATLVALIRSGVCSTSSFDSLLTGLDGLGAGPPAELLQERLRTLADRLVSADPLVRELVRAEAIARLTTLGVRAPARIVDAALTADPAIQAEQDPDGAYSSPTPSSGQSLSTARLYLTNSLAPTAVSSACRMAAPRRWPSGSSSPTPSRRSTWPRFSRSARPLSAAARRQRKS